MLKHYSRRKRAHTRRNSKLQEKAHKKGHAKGYEKGQKNGFFIGFNYAKKLARRGELLRPVRAVQRGPPPRPPANVVYDQFMQRRRDAGMPEPRNMEMLHARRARHREHINKKRLESLTKQNRRGNVGQLDLVTIASELRIEYYAKKLKPQLIAEIRAKGGYPGYV